MCCVYVIIVCDIIIIIVVVITNSMFYILKLESDYQPEVLSYNHLNNSGGRPVIRDRPAWPFSGLQRDILGSERLYKSLTILILEAGSLDFGPKQIFFCKSERSYCFY